MHDSRKDDPGTEICSEQDEPDFCFVLGHYVVCVVYPRILPCLGSNTLWIDASGMALGLAVVTFVGLCGFCLGFASVGNRILRLLKLEMESDAGHLLVAVAVGLTASEIFLFLVQVTQQIREGCLALVVLFCILLFAESESIWRRCKLVWSRIVPSSTADLFLLSIIAVVTLVEFLASQAPLTGSDAMHYHFTVQKQILGQGFHPIFSNSHSFLCGQSHLLILLGLSLGSENLALGFIFLGGMLTAASLAYLAAQWASDLAATVFTLVFLLTPVVFWQITSSGSPDIYMAFFVSTTVILLNQKNMAQKWQRALLVGLLAGSVGGAKYTGCFIAAAIGLAFLVEFRTAMSFSIFLLGALFSGIWPYLRNLVWTGNPVFPFLSAWLSPRFVTAYAVKTLASDTGASSSHHLTQVLPFMFLAASQRNNPGLYDFFGPTVLVLAPFMLLAFRKDRPWRVSILVWWTSSLAIFFASGLPRFLLPVFPIALACAAAGWQVSLRQDWTVSNRIVTGLLALIALSGGAGLALDSYKPICAAIGLQDKTRYLEERAPDYQVVQAVNQLLARRENWGKTLIFIRHLYYLKVSFLNGDPSTSFDVDPERMKTASDWRAFFGKNDVGYVVRSPDYPGSIRQPLEEMERTGELIPLSQIDVQNFQGMRLTQTRVTVPVVILKIKH